MKQNLPNWQFDWLAPVYDWMNTDRNWELIEDALDITVESSLLDLGGGTGQVGEHYEEKFTDAMPDITVLDYNQNMLEEGVSKDIQTRFVRGTALRMPFLHDSYDRVFLGDAFHHMPEHSSVLREIKRMLSSDGLLVFEEFDPGHPLGLLLYGFELLLGMKSTFYRPDTLTNRLQELDFEVDFVKTDSFTYVLRAQPAD